MQRPARMGPAKVQFVLASRLRMLALGLLLPQLLLATAAQSYRLIDESHYLHQLIEQLQQQRPIKTLLLLQRQQQLDCPLQQLHPPVLPVLRADETQRQPLAERFNDEAIALVCLSQLEDFVLLLSLADNLQAIRETRILLWLYNRETDLQTYFERITGHAQKHNFLNMLVLDVDFIDRLSLSGYRLQPFPLATLRPFALPANGTMYTQIWRDFGQKPVRTMPSQQVPSSFLARDTPGGQLYLGGYMDRLVLEFARIHNMQLIFQRPLNASVWISDRRLKELVQQQQLDLPLHGHVLDFNTTFTDFLDIVQIFIVVPCGRQMRLGDVYRGLRNYFLIILAAYLVFALLHQLFECVRCPGYRWRPLDSLVNLRVFAGALGLPIWLIRRYGSLSLRQLLMMMCLFSLVVSCFFGANLSALLTKLPCYQHIENFEQLQRSGLPVIFDEVAASMTELQVNRRQIGTLSRKLLQPSCERNRRLFDLDTSHGYQISSRIWEIVDSYQSRFERRSLCFSPGLILFYDYPIVGLLQPNSVYKSSLNSFIHRSHAAGLVRHWTRAALRSLISTQIVQISPHRSLELSTDSARTPLSNEDLLWLWKLLVALHALAGLIFIGEVFYGRGQSRIKFI